MDIDKERFFYYAGTALFIVAVLELTVLPMFLSTYSIQLFDSVVKNKSVVILPYLAGFIAYLLSPKYYRLQLTAIFLIFVCYSIFQLIYKIYLSAI